MGDGPVAAFPRLVIIEIIGFEKDLVVYRSGEHDELSLDIYVMCNNVVPSLLDNSEV